MTRNGKIARPHEVREEVNRRLRDNEPGEKICKWINGLPAAKAVCREFAQRRGGKDLQITVNHLSEWRRGGYQDWLREQQMLENTREMARWSAKLAKESGGDLSEGAAVLLSGQLLRLLQGMAQFENIDPPSSNYGATGHRTSNAEHRMERSGEPWATSHQGPDPHPCPLPSDGRGGSCSSAETKSTSADPQTSLRVIDPRSGFGEAERMEASVRVLRELVKCLWGIRNGDHHRVRLVQVDRKLAQRDKMIALEREKYDNEQAEIAARKREEEKRKKQEERKRRRARRLSDAGKIDLMRGKLFGPEKMIEERECELKEKQKELKILKAKFGIDGSSSCDEATEAAGEIAEKKEDGGNEPNVQSPKSNVAVASDTAVPSGSEHDCSLAGTGQSAGSETGAPNQCEPMRVNTSPDDQSQEKNGAVGGAEPDFSTHPPAQSSGATRRQENTREPGPKKFDVNAMLREVQLIDEELAALAAHYNGSPSSPGSPDAPREAGAPGQPASIGGESGKFEDENEEGVKESGKFDPDAVLRELKKFDKDAAVRKLEKIKKELAALKARRRVKDGGLPRDTGQKDASETIVPNESDSAARKERSAEDGGAGPEFKN